MKKTNYKKLFKRIKKINPKNQSLQIDPLALEVAKHIISIENVSIKETMTKFQIGFNRATYLLFFLTEIGFMELINNNFVIILSIQELEEKLKVQDE